MLSNNRAPTRRTRILLGLASAACLAAVAAAPAAIAQPSDQSHDRGTQTFTGEICGLEGIETTVDFVRNAKSRMGKNGYLLYQNSGRSTVTWYNPETGLTVVRKSAGSSKDISVTNRGGVITVLTQQTGVPQEIRSSDGTVALKDVGRVVLETIWWDRDTPLDTSDDRFIEGRVVSTSGPHPDAEANFTLSCDAIVEGLT